MYKISAKRNVLDSLLLSDGSTRNGVIDNMQYVVNQQEMVTFCPIKNVLTSLLYLKSL